MSEHVTLKIYDEDYRLVINSSIDRERIERVADYVDRKMKETASNYANLSVKHVAVLAALNIAEEYIGLREHELEQVSTGADFDETDTPRINRISEKISQALSACE